MTERKGSSFKYEEMEELRRGPWTLEEDTLLIHYIACHGEGRWNLLARCSGLKRTGKSCRLRWLNYLKPDIKRGNLSPEEQLLILELHSKWGNRWSRIAQHLPGRTDNEIKNYWRTRVQKQARQLKVDANSALFRDAVRCYWIPRLLDRKMGCSSSSTRQALDAATTATATENLATNTATMMQALDQGPYLCYNDASMQYDLLPDQFPVLAESELPSRSIDEFDGVTSNPASSGYSSMNDAYQGLDEPWDPALTSSSPTPTSDHLATNLASLWSMDELYDILQSTL